MNGRSQCYSRDTTVSQLQEGAHSRSGGLPIATFPRGALPIAKAATGRSEAIPRLLIDTREQRPLTFSDRVEVERATLPTGDYSVAGCTDVVALERKSLADLVLCVAQERERFEECLRRLEAYPVRALVIEATPLDVQAHAYRSQVRPQSVLGSVIAWQVDRALPVVWAGNAQLAAWLVERLLVRVWRRRSAGASVGEHRDHRGGPDAAA